MDAVIALVFGAPCADFSITSKRSVYQNAAQASISSCYMSYLFRTTICNSGIVKCNSRTPSQFY